MAWHPLLSVEVENLFEHLSVFDAWSNIYNVTQSGDQHLANDQERKRRSREPATRVAQMKAVDTAARMWAMKCEGATVKQIAEATGRSVGCVSTTLRKVQAGAAVRPHGGSARRAA